jgi:hypothetical protein
MGAHRVRALERVGLRQKAADDVRGVLIHVRENRGTGRALERSHAAQARAMRVH